MKIALRRLEGHWDEGWALDRHTVRSVCVGHDENGRPLFETERTEVGEAIYRLKYRAEHALARPLAQAVAEHICARLDALDAIVPMPASVRRAQQPVGEVARALGEIVGRPVLHGLLTRRAVARPMKDLSTKAEKLAAIGDGFDVSGRLCGDWRRVLLLDDLFATGATMQAAYAALRTCTTIERIHVAALTWKPP